MSTSPSLLIDAAWPVAQRQALPRNVVLALAGSALIAISAHLQVPMWPVPMTMQPFAVLLIGLAFGSRLGAATVALYLFEGAIGLPVFSKGGGFVHLMGPTGGYLIGFLAAAFAVGFLAERGWGRPALRVFAAMVVGMAVIYLFGVAWLSSLIGLDKAITAGLLPFLVGDVVKALLAAAVLPGAWALLGRPGAH